MAQVDLAEDTLLGRPVALKRVAGPASDQGLSRLRREALAGASLSHPNLVAVYDVVTSDEGQLVIVMEYIAGGTLREALNQRRRLPAEEALRVLGGVAAGLDAIHDRGIVHRDVKPSNILLGEGDGGAVKVADLGIAAIPDRTRITTAGSVLGSLSYMAPEQLDNSPSTPSIDVYALAAVAYEVLSGEKARRETNPVTLAHAIATQAPPDLRNAWPDAPPGAADLLVRGMARDAADRPRTAGELVGQLRTNANITKLLGYSVELYGKLEAETGQATGWKRNGGLRLACNEDRWIEVKRQATHTTTSNAEEGFAGAMDVVMKINAGK